MSREFYMGDSFNRGYDYDEWNMGGGFTAMSCRSDFASNSTAASLCNDGGTSGISKRLSNIESSLEKVCNGCVKFAANVDEAREAFKKMAESLNKLGVGVRPLRANLKTLGGNGRYV